MSGLPWIQLAADWKGHKKAIRLRVFLGDEWAWAYVVSLWCWSAQHAGDGVLEGPGTLEVIADAAGWKGDPKHFVDCLVRAGLLDEVEKGYRIHDWGDYAGAHIEKREKERNRLRTYRERTRTKPVRSAYVHGETETETETERETGYSITSRPEGEGLAGQSVTLRAFRETLSSALGLTGLIAIAKPEEAQGVADFFEAQLVAVGPEWLLRDCLAAAAKAKTTPGSLKWLKGWVEKLHTPTAGVRQ